MFSLIRNEMHKAAAVKIYTERTQEHLRLTGQREFQIEEMAVSAMEGEWAPQAAVLCWWVRM